MPRTVLRACCVCVLVLTSTAIAATPVTSTIEYPGLGTVTVEQPVGAPAQFVIFLSGDGGWNQGVAGMAHHLVHEGALVAGVDVPQMAKHQDAARDTCVRPSEIFEGLSHFVQQKYGMSHYALPILVGYSSGATLAYATLAQSPPGTFKGAMSLGFCPDLEWRKPLCRGEGLERDPAPTQGFVYRPAAHLQDPWIALQGEQDEVCAAKGTRDFVARVGGAEVVDLPRVGHGYSVERRWLPHFTDSYRKLAASSGLGTRDLPIDVKDLPLIELPASRTEHDVLAIMLSGDGGWAGLDKAVAAQLNARGVPLVGWDSLRYFWNARTPDGAARDLDRVIRHYSREWHKSKVLLIGYSQGADVMPFLVNRLAQSTRSMLAGTALIGMGTEAFFEFSVRHWLGQPTGGLPIRPEIERGLLGRVQCIYGSDEQDSSCLTLRADGLEKTKLPGGHHFDGDYAAVAAAVVKGLPP